MGKRLVYLLFFGLLLFGFLSSGVHAQVTLSIHPLQVKEYSSQTLLCAYTGTNTVNVISWFKSGAPVGHLNNACQPLSTPPDPTLYSYNCSFGTGTFALTILNVTRANKGETFQCIIYNTTNSGFNSNKVSPDIIVPISSVTMTQPVTEVVTVQVNTTAVFVCETSGGLPTAQVSWFKDSGTPDNTADDINITSWSSYSTNNTSDYLIKVTSRLDYSPIKLDRNMRIYCTANNGGSNTYASSRKPLLDVQYPPESPPVIRQGPLNVTEQTSYVTEQTQSTLSCSITGGNPLANLTWNCYNGVITHRTSGETVTKEVTWTASRGQDGACTCLSYHYSWSRSVSIRIEILYPPSTPTFTIGAKSINDIVAVIQNKTLTINCYSNSKPLPNYTWRYKDSTTSGYQMSIPNIQTSNNGLYTCEAQNKMTPSVGDSVTGKQNASVTVQVLYAPVVLTLASEDIVEGQRLTKVCEATPGNPPTTNFKWTKETDKRTWQSHTLSIVNVSRSDASYYKCTATNRMTPTVESEVTGEDSKSFFLNVLYSSSIRLFTLNGVQESNIVSENDPDLPLICDVDSNPGSVITIEHDGKILLTQNDAKHLNYSLERAQCTDAGYYRCIGRNAYNSQPSVKVIRLFVKCSPRPSPFVSLIDRVRTGLYRTTSLKFSALAYPEPTAFKWFKVINLALLPIEHTDNTLITSEAVNTSLTIVSVTENSFGKYLLTVHNELGVWNQSYYIEAYDKPEPPNDFKSLDEKTTISSVTLQWVPGFNGGQPQTFVLQYRKKGTEQWTSVNIIHHNETMMTYPIQHLSGGTQYEVVVFATNNIGNSTQSQRITVSTYTPVSRPGNTGAIIGGSVGGGTACAILIAVGVIIIRRIRIRKDNHPPAVQFCDGNRDKQIVLNNESALYTDLQTSQHEYTNMTPEYSELKTRSESIFDDGIPDLYTDIRPKNSSIEEHIYNARDSTRKAEPEDAKVYVNLQIRHNQPSS